MSFSLFLIEMFTHHASPIQSIGQQAPGQLRQTISPTPLAFTPTSVLRKMTADKDTSSSSNTNLYPQNAKKQDSHNNIMNDAAIMSANSGIGVQPRMILGGNYAMQQQQQHSLNANNPQISTKLLPQLSQVRCQPQVKWPPGGNMPHVKSFGEFVFKTRCRTYKHQMVPVFCKNIKYIQEFKVGCLFFL